MQKLFEDFRRFVSEEVVDFENFKKEKEFAKIKRSQPDQDYTLWAALFEVVVKVIEQIEFASDGGLYVQFYEPAGATTIHHFWEQDEDTVMELEQEQQELASVEWPANMTKQNQTHTTKRDMLLLEPCTAGG